MVISSQKRTSPVKERCAGSTHLRRCATARDNAHRVVDGASASNQQDLIQKMGPQPSRHDRRPEKVFAGACFADSDRERLGCDGPEIEISAADAGIQTRLLRQIDAHALTFKFAATRPSRLAVIVVLAVAAAAEARSGMRKTARRLRRSMLGAAAIALVRMMPATSKHRMDEEQNRSQVGKDGAHR
ncbi:MAG TPA: hypothetical protein VFW87_04185 [Pirellulales bacterium]|nr:hypothetical protein [Pirellulales bacterium]